MMLLASWGLGSALTAVCSATTVFVLSSLLGLIFAKMTLLCMCRIEGSYHLPDDKRHI